MKSRHLGSSRGSAMLTVAVMITVLSVLTASIIQYSVNERKANERHRLILRARNMAENTSIYAAEQLTTKLYRLRSNSPMAFIGGTNQVYLPPADVFSTGFTSLSNVEVWAGISSSTALHLVTDTTDPNVGLSVSTSTAPIISKASATNVVNGTVTDYVEQDMQLSLIPLFQFAIFYNMDLEFSPGSDMVISGPVHTNGNLIARNQTGFSNTLQFTDRTTAAGGFYADTAHLAPMYRDDDSVDSGPGGTGHLYFQDTSGNVTDIYSGSIWRDYKYGNATETTATDNNFKTFASNTYAGNFRTSVHNVVPLYPPGVERPTSNSTPAQDHASARKVIMPPSSSDTAQDVLTKFSRNAGLYIVVNPDDDTRYGILPDGSTVSMPGFSYRCWINKVDASGNHTMQEVVLPGQPSYGTNNATQNNLPNRFTDKTNIITNQVLRIPLSPRLTDLPIAGFTLSGSTSAYDRTLGSVGNLSNSSSSLPDAYFYDLRRANNSLGHPFNRTNSVPFAPRPIAKIDLDMTRFRLMVERTVYSRTTSSAIYWPNLPGGAPLLTNLPSTNAQWSAFIYNPNATPTTYNLGVNLLLNTTFSDYPVLGVSGALYSADPFKMYFATGTAVAATDLVTTAGTSPWFDGITVYVHSVEAEIKTGTATARDRMDSGVRFWNGRGPLVSLDSTNYPNRTGSNFCTNDCAYIVGHYNADGTINSDSTSTGTGGYSARYPDSTREMLTVVSADAITILSQPVFNSSYAQTSGWNDSLSGSRRDNAGNYSSSWATTNPSSSNSEDGVSTSIHVTSMPNLSYPLSTGSTRDSKFAPSVTEISSCLMTGIVESVSGQTTGNQTSGGVHNFPRLLEYWQGTGLYIRGSMVAMFSSAVGTEPWSLRLYTAAGRYWGFHENLRSPTHDVPLEPIVAGASRMRYYELTASQYATQKAAIAALPH